VCVCIRAVRRRNCVGGGAPPVQENRRRRDAALVAKNFFQRLPKECLKKISILKTKVGGAHKLSAAARPAHSSSLYGLFTT